MLMHMEANTDPQAVTVVTSSDRCLSGGHNALDFVQKYQHKRVVTGSHVHNAIEKCRYMLPAFAEPSGEQIARLDLNQFRRGKDGFESNRSLLAQRSTASDG